MNRLLMHSKKEKQATKQAPEILDWRKAPQNSKKEKNSAI